MITREDTTVDLAKDLIDVVFVALKQFIQLKWLDGACSIKTDVSAGPHLHAIQYEAAIPEQVPFAESVYLRNLVDEDQPVAWAIEVRQLAVCVPRNQ
ncbi:MAG: hypothetical protein JW395_0359 [Nitrospira sp.]|nr:hypothetical protein [Nitrospira sp.]